jgi:hypothetical protein
MDNDTWSSKILFKGRKGRNLGISFHFHRVENLFLKRTVNGTGARDPNYSRVAVAR